MKRFIQTSAFFALAAMMVSASGVMTTQAFAAENPMNEVGAATSSSLTFGTGANTTFTLSADYSRTMMDMLQATVVAGFAMASLPVGSAKVITAQVGPTFDYALDSTGIRNAVYLRALGGLAYASNSATGTSVSSTNFAYTLEVGKRFELFSVVSWDPAFNMTGTTATGANPVYAFVPVQLSFIF